MAQAASRKLKAAMRGDQLAFDFGIAVVDADEARRARERERARRWYSANPERRREQKRQYRAANRERFRENNNQYNAARPEKVRERNRKYRAANIEKLREYDLQRRAANPEKGREYTRQYRAANPEKVRESQRRYRAANLEKINARRAASPERHLEDKRRRRARIAGNGVYLVTQRDLARLLNRQGGTCAWCDASESLHVDHIIPIARGGAHGIGNLQYLCAPHNLSKHTHTRTEWLKRNPQPTDGRP